MAGCGGDVRVVAGESTNNVTWKLAGPRWQVNGPQWREGKLFKGSSS